MKTCTKCTNEQPLDCFIKDRTRRDGLHPWCKSCRQQWHRHKFETNPEYRQSLTDRKTQWQQDNPERSKRYKRDWHLQDKYDLTQAEFDEMLASQGGTCALCPATTSDSTGRPLSIDHCHVTGRVRGLLCTNCNTAVGVLESTAAAADMTPRELVDHTIEFLTNPPAHAVLHVVS